MVSETRKCEDTADIMAHPVRRVLSISRSFLCHSRKPASYQSRSPLGALGLGWPSESAGSAGAGAVLMEHWRGVHRPSPPEEANYGSLLTLTALQQLRGWQRTTAPSKAVPSS